MKKYLKDIKGGGNLGYLICKKCGGYYELQDGESPEDFSECECGGTLEYVNNVDFKLKSGKESLKCPFCGKEITAGIKFCGKCGKNISKDESKPHTKGKNENPLNTYKTHKSIANYDPTLKLSQKSNFSIQKDKISKFLLNSKDNWLKSNSHMKIISLGGVLILFVIIAALILPGNIAAAHYDNNSISFDYPTDWNLTDVSNRQSNSDASGGEASNASGLASPINTTELTFFGPGINKASVMIYTLDQTQMEDFKANQLEGFTKKTINGYTYYESRAKGGNSHNTGIFLKDNTGYTIIVAGNKQKADNAFNMIVNSFKIK